MTFYHVPLTSWTDVRKDMKGIPSLNKETFYNLFILNRLSRLRMLNVCESILFY
jgi:hypothetical protein